MDKKTINISLPQIEGMVLKNATVDLKKGVVVAKYGEEEYLIEAKRGDFLTLKTDPSKVVIFDTMAGILGGVPVFTIIYDLPIYINGVPASTPKGVKMPVSRFRHSTEREKQFMIKEMEKLGKKYNPKTFKVENIEKDMPPIKTFKDLEFVMHPISLNAKPQDTKSFSSNSKYAIIEFENGYGVSVLFGDIFYSNGIDTYEVAILKDGYVCFDIPLNATIFAYKNEDEVTEIMRKVQKLDK